MTETSNLTEQQRTPSEKIAQLAEKGLDFRKKFSRGGTEVGVARARDLKNRKALTVATIKRMYSYFKRHEVDKRSKNFGDDENPSAGYIAWLLWGGDEAKKWVEDLMKKI